KSDGIAATEIYHGAICKTNRNLLYIGAQDNGGFYYNNGTFYNDRAGDYGPSMWFDYSSNYYYEESREERRPYPSGSVTSLNLPETPSGGKFAFTPANINIAYHANAGKVYRCSNLTSASPSWTLIYTVPSGTINDLQIDPSNADRLYVFTDLPALYRSDNATTDASFVEKTLPTTATTGSVAPIPNSDVVYLGLGNTIYRSADKGETWTATKGFPEATVIKVVADHKSTNEAIYACYALGAYYKDNTKSSWINYSSGLPIICEMKDMDIYNDGISKGVLNVYYYGRGVWQSDLVPPPSNITVALTSPVNNTTFSVSGSATINLNATAVVSSGNISKVEFYNGTTLLGTGASSPYIYSWNDVLPGKYDLTAVAYDNLGNKKSSDLVTLTVTFVCNKITGTTFGTSPYAAGSEYDKAFDGDINTAFDASAASTAYTGLDLGTAKVVTNIRYYPIKSNAGRMLGGKFQGSNTSNSADFVDLYTIQTQPNYGWQDVSIPNSKTYRYYRYLSPVDGYCNVAEIEFCAFNESPTVNITAPINNKLYTTVPANINITATASDADGSISRVEFYQGATLLGTDTSSPYSFNWTGVPAGTYELIAKAYDNLNAEMVSSIISVIVGNKSPIVSIISPDDYAVYTDPGNINIYATASDSDGTISKVEFYNGTTLLGTSTTSPYSYNWTSVPIGTYRLTAKAYDNNGVVTTSSEVLVRVNQSPTVSITTPGDNTIYLAPATFAISAAANDTDGTISKVEFYNGSSLLGTSTSSPYSYNWTSVPIGRYTLTAKAYDNNGGVTTSSAVLVRVNQSPTVSITTPGDNAIYLAPATLAISARANDTDGNISKVEFYNGATLLGTVNTSPYTYTWTNVAAGTYVLTAKAYDNDNGISTSSSIAVIVNDAPRVSITAPTNNSNYMAPAFVTINASATDANGSVSRVEFYNGINLIATSTTTPYTCNLTSLPAGAYSLTAKA
ncbi:Ig-like domain-containing protein, partial [Flavobacterium sp. T12S277]|uniref:Ig-like domain-containing protein n=1 Tax=Flavobacterium sp. T12S277 TaxID=3402752 RepID=UPI003ADE5C1B